MTLPVATLFGAVGFAPGPADTGPGSVRLGLGSNISRPARHFFRFVLHDPVAAPRVFRYLSTKYNRTD